MFKKIELWIVLLLIIFFIIISILFGALISNFYMHKYEWKTFSKGRFPKIQSAAVFISEIPRNIKIILSDDLKIKSFTKHQKKNKFNKFINQQRNELIILPIYNGDTQESEVRVVDINTFEILHVYKHDVRNMNKNIESSNQEFYENDKFNSKQRFLYIHPLILSDGSLISSGVDGVLFKIDLCSNIVWINQEDRFHHSKNLTADNNIWAITSMYPYSELINKQFKNYGLGFRDDAITKISNDGKLIYTKSISEILLQNDLIGDNIFQTLDPIHANDVQPALFSTEYWKKDDVFISIRNQSAIIHFRPSTNKVINYIKGPFFQQHDVDIISNEEISIFNNNNRPGLKGQYSNQLIYNLREKKFDKKFERELKKENLKTITEGGSEFLDDGSLILDESNHGRILMLDHTGKKVFEYVNKDNSDNIYHISWIRIIENQDLIDKFKENKFDKKCLN